MTKRIAWIDGDHVETEPYRIVLGMDCPESLEFGLSKDATEGLASVTGNNKHNLIVINPYLAPGERYKPTSNWRTDYNLVGLDLVARIRTTGVRTPIIVASMARPDISVSDQAFIDVGADGVIDLMRVLPADFYAEVKQFLE